METFARSHSRGALSSLFHPSLYTRAGRKKFFISEIIKSALCRALE